MKLTVATCTLALVATHFCTPTAAAQCDELKFGASDPWMDDQFGLSIAAGEGVTLVGAPYTHPVGAVYAFGQQGSSWVELQKLVPAGDGDTFGHSVAIDGNRALVGDIGADGIGGSFTGAAFIFEFDGASWVQVAKISASDGDWQERFGSAVAIEGNLAAVGARSDYTGVNSGSVYVFERIGTEWVQQARLIPSLIGSYIGFGSTVAVQSDVVIAGASIVGAASAFHRSGSGWEEQRLETSGGADSVAISGDTVVVGASSGSGTVFVFRRGAAGWALEERLDPAGETSSFGDAVALRGDTLLVGDSRHGPGAAFVYQRMGSTHLLGEWVRQSRIVASDGMDDDWFGGAVAFGDDRVWFGAPDDGSGSVYSYDLDCQMVFTAYCLCARGPCGNADAIQGCANSTGLGAVLRPWSGSSNSVSADDLILRLVHLPLDQYGLVYMAPGQTCVPLGDGLRAVQAGPGQGYFRFPVHSAVGPNGSVWEGPGIVAYSAAHFGAAGTITAGSTWNFQGYYRDPGWVCGSYFNLSNGLSILFAP